MSFDKLQIKVNPEVTRKTQAILKTIDDAYRELRKQEQTGHLSFIHRISLNLEQDKVEEMLTNLVNGYLITKHSQGTKVPHQKYLYISEDRKFLCWKSLEKLDEKMMELRKISMIAEGEEIKEFKESSTLKNNKKNCFIILGETRNLEIECRNENEASKIIMELNEAMKNSRRMHLSYRF